MILYQDNDVKYTQLYRFSNGEKYQEIKEDLENLKSIGIKISSITCDGKKSMIKAIRKSNPEATLQRCVVHVHRMANIWLRKQPRSIAGNELKELLKFLPLVESHNDKEYFIREFKNWESGHKKYANEKSYSQQTERWWYKHKELRRAYSMIKQSLPDLFHYVYDEKIPKSTNGLESYFGHLKDTISIHRGLSLKHRKQFIKWYLHLKNKT